MRRWIVCLAVLVLFMALGGGGTARAEPQDWGTGVELRKLSDAKLGRLSSPTYRRFSEPKLYFGAFVHNARTDASSFWRNVPSLAEAITIATRDCERLSEGVGTCTLYAVTVPRGFPKGKLTGTGLAQDAARAWRGDFRRKAAGAKGYAAFATSGLGDYGYGWGYGTAADAREAATLECLSGLADVMADYEPAMRRIVQARKLNQCDVVDLRRN